MIRYGIVGCGHIAKKHVAAIKAVEGAELVAVCDTDEERLRELAVDGVRGYTDLEGDCLNRILMWFQFAHPAGFMRR